MDITKQQSTVAYFRNWFTGGNSAQGQGASVKRTIEDNRRRYRMILADAAERIDLGLSALPSTKSTAIVDNAVIDAIQEYYATDAMNFTAQDDGTTGKDHLADWMSELFKIRSKRNGFWVWHLQSLKAGLVDGIEAGMVRWRKETYMYPDNHYFNQADGSEISAEEYKSAKKLGPIIMEGRFNPQTGKPHTIKIPFNQAYRAERSKKERIVADTWEVVQLKPGENLLWDFKNPLLDINRGQWAIVILQMQAEEVMSLVKQKIFKPLTLDELKPYLVANGGSTNQADYVDYTSLATDPDTVDAGDYNTAEIWMAFDRKDNQWMVSFSLQGEKELKAEESVNDIFFGGRPFDRLPVVMGASDIELWEALGRGIPKLLAPIEDELTDHRNNVNDMAKQASTGKFRLDEDSDIDINSLLNDKVFYGKAGTYDKLDYGSEMGVVLRAADMTGADIAQLAPVGMADDHLVGGGNAKDTLGGVQLAVGGNDKKLSSRILIRNITFMEPLLRIIAEMHMAFETDQSIGRVAGKKAKIDMNKLTAVVDGKEQIDFSLLDFDVEIQINAGTGNVPKQQKAGKLMAYTDWGVAHKIPLDIEAIDKQLKVLNGFSEDQFILPPEKRQAPEGPPVEYKANITVDLTTLLQLSPQAGQFLLEKMLNGGMDVTAAIKEAKDKSTSYTVGDGSPSHPAAQVKTMDQPQGQMGGA